VLPLKVGCEVGWEVVGGVLKDYFSLLIALALE